MCKKKKGFIRKRSLQWCKVEEIKVVQIPKISGGCQPNDSKLKLGQIRDEDSSGLEKKKKENC